MRINQWVWMALSLVVAVLVPSLAIAGPFDPPATDLSKTIFIDYMFGPISGGGTSPITEVVGLFNTALLSVAGVLLMYVVVAGTLSTAHDGQVLGQRWSSLWVPIRTAIGAAAVMPVIGNGFCFAQAVVIWMATQGVGIADSMWTTYVQAQTTMEGAFYAPPTALKNIRGAYANMLVSNVCVAAFRQNDDQDQAATNGIYDTSSTNAEAVRPLGPMTVMGQTIQGYHYGSLLSMDKCGYASINSLDVSGAQDGLSQLTGPSNSTSLIDANKLASGLWPVHQAYFQQGQSVLQALAMDIVNGNSSQAQVNSQLSMLTTNYGNALSDKAKALMQSQQQAQMQAMQAMAQKDGWLTAGSWYMVFARAQDAITRSITQTPTASGGPGLIASSDSALAKLFGGGGENVAAKITQAQMWVKDSATSNSGGVESFGDQGEGASWATKLVSWFINDDMLSSTNMSQYAQANQNPVVMAQNLGQKMTGWAWGSFAVGAGALGLSGVQIVGTGAGGSWATVLTPPLFTIFSILLVSGATLSTYLPMIPYILWLGVVVGWMILLVEAVIAAPLWAIVHIAPDGDGVVGRGGQGYMLVLSLFLRPPLMVFGLMCAILLMKPIGYLINTTFVGAFAMGANPGFFGLTSAICGCVIYTVTMVAVIHRVFALIHIIPDRILRWIGGDQGGLGENAGQIEGSTAARAVAGVGAVNQAGNMTQGLISGARDKRIGDNQAAAAAQAREGSRQNEIAQQRGNLQDKAMGDARTAKDSVGQYLNNPTDMNRDQAASDLAASRASQVDQAAYEATSSGTEEGAEFAAGLAAAKAQGPAATNAFLRQNADPSGAKWQQSAARAVGEQQKLDDLQSGSMSVRHAREQSALQAKRATAAWERQPSNAGLAANALGEQRAEQSGALNDAYEGAVAANTTEGKDFADTLQGAREQHAAGNPQPLNQFMAQQASAAHAAGDNAPSYQKDVARAADAQAIIEQIEKSQTGPSGGSGGGASPVSPP